MIVYCAPLLLADGDDGTRVKADIRLDIGQIARLVVHEDVLELDPLRAVVQ